MKKFGLKWLSVGIIGFVCLTVFVGGILSSSNDKKGCPIKPFAEFAYWPDETARPIPEILLGSPWQVETVIPESKGFTYGFYDFQIELARTNNGEQEIWLFKPHVLNGEGSFIIYHPRTQTWEEISALLGDTNLVVRELFVTSDGMVWGEISFDQPHSVPTSGPVLGWFNEVTQRFEAAAGGLEIPITLNHGVLSHVLEIVLDKQDVFWIFGPDDGIYRYVPRTQTTERQTDLPYAEIERLSTALAPDGSIYFQDQSLSVPEEFLFQFNPATGKIVVVDVAKYPWETSGGMLVDHRGRLWLGAMGYMETDGSWHLLHRDAPNSWKNRSEFTYWSPPSLLFESSNGLLWYAEYQDMERIGEGTAWYDPEIGEGCLFTNLASYIVEDDERNLWMIADRKLYRYALEP